MIDLGTKNESGTCGTAAVVEATLTRHWQRLQQTTDAAVALVVVLAMALAEQ
jgi:hypothetical protein